MITNKIFKYTLSILEIFCNASLEVSNGMVMLSSKLVSVGTTANYSCDPGYVLVGETTRTCEDTNSGTLGRWSGDNPICK